VLNDLDRYNGVEGAVNEGKLLGARDNVTRERVTSRGTF
jgi:hypothetical protein